MASFRYRALTHNGEVVSGTISAPTAAEVAHRIEYLGLIPIETISDEAAKPGVSWDFSFLSRARPGDVTIFTGDLALLLKTGARINDALELFSADSDIDRLRPTVSKITASILAGESFADALGHHPDLFPPMYLALVRVGEASSTLVHILEVLGTERVRSEALRRRLSDALRYPAFVLGAASAVLLFFLVFVLPQFANVLRDFNAKIDPALAAFLSLSDVLKDHTAALAAGLVILIGGGWYLLRQPKVWGWIMEAIAHVPIVNRILSFHRTSVFCRNLGVLLGSGVPLTSTLRILADMMATTGRSAAWSRTVDLVRHGGKLSDALAETQAIPPMAIRTLRLGEESGQLPMLAERIAEFYEAKLQRSLDRVVGIVGPAAIVGISIIVGGLIVSVMTALMSVSQVVG
ncbi:type II secretion system F family protein [Methylocapsa aurea]|uniref:type II secretion system F family protein n=1 Tax=Methylocapsa aurea TaxID=663610 RepID=UPI00055A23C8|nr:type II secretion system F family protein [Methylocapsa aurea]